MSRRWAAGAQRDVTDRLAARQTSPRTVVTSAARRLRTAKASFYIRTPRPMRSRVTAAGGRSPGSRVAALDRLPRHLSAPSGISVASSPLTVAGAAAALSPRSLLIPCGNHQNHRGSGYEKRQAHSVERRVVLAFEVCV